MRPQAWPAMLDRYIDDARDRAFAWGSHDCVTFTAGWFKQMTGRDVHARFRGQYDTEAGALKIMAANGVRSIESAGRFLFGDPAPSLNHTGRGDIVTAADALGICIGNAAVMLGPQGLTMLRRDQFTTAWKV